MAGPTLTTEELRHLIEDAFAETEYPGDHALVYDTSGYHLECNEIAAAFRGRHWRELSLDTLLYHHAALFFFTPEAYLYYLPAYLLASALLYHEADVIPGTLVFSLTPPDQRNITIGPVVINQTPPKQTDIDDYQQILERCTPQQGQAIRRFLEFMKANYAENDPNGYLDRALASFASGGNAATGNGTPG
jgi:hypothetical protein